MTPASREIAFIDSSIADWETLLAGLNEGIEVVILDQTTDGLLQIADSLRNASGISAIHIFSHGSSGELRLGDAVVNTGNLEQFSAALATIGNALSESGDILLYGCTVRRGTPDRRSLRNWRHLRRREVHQGLPVCRRP
jgi:hypothetical protein